MAKEFDLWINHPYTVVDGDTFDCELDMGLGIYQRPVRIRLKGVDAPEMRQPNVVGVPENAAAARKALHDFLQATTAPLKITSHYRDGWQRLVATIWLDGNSKTKSLQDALLEQGHVVLWKKS